MLKIAVLVSGGGTNLQAIIDAIADGTITNTKIEVVVSSNPRAYALERAMNAGIDTVCISPKSYTDRRGFHQALTEYLLQRNVDLIVLAGFMVVIPEILIRSFRNRIINIHPSLIPSFCGKGYYGIHVHEAALARGVKISGATPAPLSCRRQLKCLRTIHPRPFRKGSWSRQNGRSCPV